MKFNHTKYNTSWEDKTLEELGTFNRGKSKHRPRNDVILFENGKYPLIQTGDVKSSNLYINKHTVSYNDVGLAQSKMWKAGTLCITIAANIAETAILKKDMCFPDSVVGFNANANETSEIFMHYVFTYIRKAIQNSVTGSIQDNINIDYLKQLNFKIPKVNEQKKIASILSTLDEKIELNNKINAELEAMAKTLYDYWFVQFEFPNEDGKPYKSSGGKMIYSPELKREIPEGWEVGEYQNYIHILTGKAFKSEDYINLGIFVLRTKNFNDGYVYNKHDDVYLPLNYQEKHKNFMVKELDYHVVMVGASIGATGMVFEHMLPALRNQNMWCLRRKSNSFVSQIFVKYATDKIIKNICGFSSGSARDFLTKNNLGEYKISVATPYMQKKFDNIFQPIYKKISNHQKQNQELIKIRDFLLPMLMNGQVQVA